jgi:hypothetical protein
VDWLHGITVCICDAFLPTAFLPQMHRFLARLPVALFSFIYVSVVKRKGAACRGGSLLFLFVINM